MTLPLKWAKMMETEFVPHEYHDQHKNRTKKWAVDIGPNTAPISYDDPEYFTRRGDMLSRIKYFFDEEGNYNLEEYDWEGNLIPQESY